MADEHPEGSADLPGGRTSGDNETLEVLAARLAREAVELGVHRLTGDFKRMTVGAPPGNGDDQADTELADWAERFDAKLDELTARQDAFLKYLEMRSHAAGPWPSRA